MNDKKFIIFFGAAGSGKFYCNWTDQKPHYFIDNDINKWEKTLLNIKIKSPNFLSEIINNIDKIVITSDYVDEILPQLKEIGVSKEKIIIPPKAYLAKPLFGNLAVRQSSVKFLNSLMFDHELEGIVAVGGTALGFCRDGDFIKWDGDIDLFAPKKYQTEVFNIFKKNFDNTYMEGETIKSEIKIQTDNDLVFVPIGIDLYDSNLDEYKDRYGDHEWIWPVRTFINPTIIKIHDLNINVPKFYYKYLSGIYGKSWKIPNKKFTYLDYGKNN